MDGPARSVRRSIVVAASIAAGLVMAALLMLEAVNRAPGRWMITEFANGFDTGSVGVVELEGLSGRVLSSPRIERIALRDDDGIWFEARDLEINWSGLALIRGRISIDEMYAAQVRFVRVPGVEPGDGGGDGGPLPSTRLGRVDLPEIILEDAVLGERFALSLLAAIPDLSGRDDDIRLEVSGLGGTPDTLSVRVGYRNGDEIAADIIADAPPGGLLATALGMPERRLLVEGQLNGALRSARGELRLLIDDEEALESALSLEGEHWEAVGQVETGVIDEFVDLLPAQIDFTAAGRVTETWPDRLSVTGLDLSLSAQKRGDEIFDLALDLGPDFLRVLDESGVMASRARLMGEADPAANRFAGRIALTELAGHGVQADMLGGPIEFQVLDEQFLLNADIAAAGLVLPNATAQAQIGSSPNIVLAAQWTPASDHLQLSEARVTAANLTARLAGEWQASVERWSMTGEAEVLNFVSLAEGVEGPVGMQLDAAGTHSLPFDGRLELDVAETSLPDWSRSMLDGFQLIASPGEGGESEHTQRFEIDASGLALQARLQLDPESGDWQLAGDAGMATPVTGDAVWSGEAIAAFDLAAIEDELTLRTEASTQSLELNGFQVAAPRLRSELSLDGEAMSLQWSLMGASDAGEIDLQGGLLTDSEGPVSARLAGQAGPALVQADARWNGASISSQAQIRDLQETPRWTLAAGWEGRPDRWQEAELDLALDIAAGGQTNGWLDEATLSAQGRVESLDIRGNATGSAGEAFSLALDGETQLEGEVFELVLGLDGLIGSEAISTRTPLRLTTGPELVRMGTVLDLAEGWVEAEFIADNAQTRLQLMGEDISVPVLSRLARLPDLDGRLGLDADLAIIDEAVLGHVSLNADSLMAASAIGIDPLDVAIRLESGDQLDLGVDIQSESVSGQVELSQASGLQPATLPQSLMPVHWGGNASLQGDLLSLAAVLLPDGESLAGQFDLAFSRPDDLSQGWTGHVRMRDGHYQSAASGFDLSAIALDARIQEGGIQVVSASASDGLTGRVEGSGGLDWREQPVAGALRAEYTDLRIVDRPDAYVQASGYADVSLGDQEILVRGATEILEARITPVSSDTVSIPTMAVEEINRPDGDIAARTPITLRLDYEVTSAGDTFISSQNYSTEWSADIDITGPVNALELQGSANLEAGRAFLLGRDFRIEDGQVSFDGPPMEAELDVEATHERSGFKAIIEVGGTLAAPTIDASSEPELPPDEIFARLLFDQSLSALSTLEAAQLAATISGQDMFGMVSQIRDAVGIDRLDLSTGDDGEVVVTSGRQFGDRLYVEVESSNGQALGSTRLEWTLTPDISILSRLTGDTDASLSVRWRTEYD